MKPGSAAFAFIFITVVLDMLALGVMIPVLPGLIVELRGGDMASAARTIGWFGFVWAAMQFIFSPVIGGLSDRFGRRAVVLLSNLGLGLDSILMALAPSVTWLLIGRVISGITAASFPTAAAYIADVTPPEQRAEKFGQLGAAFGLGFIVGPAFGGLLGNIDLRLPFWVAAALSLLNFVYGLFVLPESLPEDRRSKFSWTAVQPLGALGFIRSRPGLGGLAIAGFLYFLAHESLPSIFVLYTGYRLQWTQKTVGIVLAVLGVLTTLVSAVLVGKIVGRLGERWTGAAGLASGALGFAIYSAAASSETFLIGLPFIALMGIANPAMSALMSHRVGASEQGQLQGATGALRGITGMIGPLLFTQILSDAIARPGGFPGAAFATAAGMMVAALFCLKSAER